MVIRVVVLSDTDSGSGFDSVGDQYPFRYTIKQRKLTCCFPASWYLTADNFIALSLILMLTIILLLIQYFKLTNINNPGNSRTDKDSPNIDKYDKLYD